MFNILPHDPKTDSIDVTFAVRQSHEVGVEASAFVNSILAGEEPTQESKELERLDALLEAEEERVAVAQAEYDTKLRDAIAMGAKLPIPLDTRRRDGLLTLVREAEAKAEVAEKRANLAAADRLLAQCKSAETQARKQVDTALAQVDFSSLLSLISAKCRRECAERARQVAWRGTLRESL